MHDGIDLFCDLRKMRDVFDVERIIMRFWMARFDDAAISIMREMGDQVVA